MTRRYQISKHIPNERLVRQIDRRRHRELFMVAATGLSLTVAVLAYGWQHFEMIRNGYRLEELRLERDHLIKIQRQLSLERDSLASPDRIEAIAKQELRMIAPTDEQIVVIEPYPTPEGARAAHEARGTRTPPAGSRGPEEGSGQ